MTERPYDVVVVGGGLAGIACAGTLVTRGLRPLLISESAEVGWTLRSVWLDGCRGLVQHPGWQMGWGGGWWFGLARELNIPLKVHISPPVHLTIRGSGTSTEIPICGTAATLTDLLVRVSPLPIADHRKEFERVLQEALAIPYQELLKMRHVPILEWLEKQGADELVQFLVCSLAANMSMTSGETAREHLSVLGAFGMLRGTLCGEGLITIIEPDAREGLAIPLARRIEELGGTVWRGRKVARVVTRNGAAAAVEMEDGEVVEAPTIAMAVGNARLRKLFDPLPSELVAPLDYSASLGHQDFTTFTVLDQPVVKLDRYLMMSDTMGSNLMWAVPLHALSPWTATEGRQFVLCQTVLTDAQAGEYSGEDAVYAQMAEYQEEIYPGFRDATTASATQSHRYHWIGPLTVGPKVQRTIPSVSGLWFVGDETDPIGGLGMDAAASGGCLGGRAIAAELSAR